MIGRPGDLTALLPALVYDMDFALSLWGAFGYSRCPDSRRRHVTVALTGHRGDELFPGYPEHFGATAGSTAMFDVSARPGAPLDDPPVADGASPSGHHHVTVAWSDGFRRP